MKAVESFVDFIETGRKIAQNISTMILELKKTELIIKIVKDMHMTMQRRRLVSILAGKNV